MKSSLQLLRLVWAIAVAGGLFAAPAIATPVVGVPIAQQADSPADNDEQEPVATFKVMQAHVHLQPVSKLPQLLPALPSFQAGYPLPQHTLFPAVAAEPVAGLQQYKQRLFRTSIQAQAP